MVELGYSLALSGDGNTALASDTGVNGNIGSAFVFARNGNLWSTQADLTASDGVVGDSFSDTLALSIDGNTALISAYAQNNSTGAAYIFVRSGSTWSQQAKLTASDGAANDIFGDNLVLSVDGNTALIGARQKNSETGAAYVFVRSGSTWSQQAKLTASDGAVYDWFGYSLALSVDCNTALIGAYGKNNATGAAYVFVRSGSTWSQQAKLAANDSVADDYFGAVLRLSVDGNKALIIAAKHRLTTPTGVAYVFVRSGSTWSQQTKLIASDGAVNDWFGNSTGNAVALSVDGNTAFISAFGNNAYTGAVYNFSTSSSASTNTGLPSPEMGAWANTPVTDNLINLYTGEKVETMTDLVVPTSVGPLAFTRTYRQARLANFQFMGLGWTHNHNLLLLVNPPGTTNSLVVIMANGGESLFTQSAITSHYIAAPGSAAAIDYVSGTPNKYVLTMPDQSSFTFQQTSTGEWKIAKRNWPTLEEWDYAYDVNGHLTLVVDPNYVIDGSSTKRQLTFSYFNAGPFNGLLQQVSDHSGRTVQFAYTLSKKVDTTGAIVNDTLALLTGVTDTLGSVWSYSYYGHDTVNETDARQLNLLTQFQSPLVDTTGSGTAASRIALTKLSYTIFGTEQVVNGDMEADSDWVNIPTGVPTTDARSSIQVHTGSYARHVITSAAGQGIQSDPFTLVAGLTYIVTAWVYAVSGSATMQLSTDTSATNVVSSGTGVWKLLRFLYQPRVTLWGTQLQFIANSATAEFYVDTVSCMNIGISAIHSEDGHTLIDLAVNGDMELDSDWANISGAAPTTNARSSTQTHTGIYSRHVITSAANQGIQGDAFTLTAALPHMITAWVYVISGAVKMQLSPTTTVNATSVGIGAWQLLRATYTPGTTMSGNVLQFIGTTSSAEFYVDGVSIQADNSTATLIHDYAFQPSGQNIATETTSGATTTHQFANGVYAAQQDPAGRTTSIQTNPQYRPTAITDSKNQRAQMNWTSDGKQLTQSTDAAGNTTQFTYGQNVAVGKSATQSSDYSSTQQASKAVDGNTDGNGNDGSITATNADANAWWQVDLGSSYNITTINLWNRTDCCQSRLSNYYLFVSDTPFTSINLTVTLAQSGVSNYYFSGNASSPTTQAVNRTGRYVRVQLNKTDYLSLAEVEIFDAPLNMINTTTDALGRKTQYLYNDPNYARLPSDVKVYDTDGITLIHWTKSTYDTHGRQLTQKTIDPATSVAIQETDWVYSAATDYSNGMLSTLTQKDLVNHEDSATTYFYDKVGRIIKTNQSTTFGSCSSSFIVYDAADHAVASICNYAPGASPDPTTAAAAVALFNPAQPLQNRVTTYAFDTVGRQVQTVTNAGAAYAQTTLMAYDALHRLLRTISSYVANAAITDPYIHVRSAFTHGTNNDQNLITEAAYNERGKVKSTTDVLGNVTLFGYDASAWLIKTVQFASQPAYNNSASGDFSLSKYSASDAPDKDITVLQQYDANGNLVGTTDPIGNVSFTAFDAVNRPLKTLQNASLPTYNLLADLTLQNYVFSTAADQDLLTTVEYDALGKVRRGQDVLGNWTLLGYDSQDRPVNTIRNATQPNYNFTIDRRLANYVLNNAPDQDLLSQTGYDAANRTIFSVDPLNRRSWTGYDGLGRTIQNVTNATGTATDGGVHDPRSPYYNPVLGSDQDQITQTGYDSSGRPYRTQDQLGNVTLYGFDAMDRVIKTIRNASNYMYSAATDSALAHYAPAPNATVDQDVITQTIYDGKGRVMATIDALGQQTQYRYDALDRTITTISNFMMGVFNPKRPDQDLTSTTVYDLAGRVVSTTDPRGTVTTISYDTANRALKVTQASGTSLATTSYTCYDKAGRTLRAIRNWIYNASQASPDARDARGNWLFAPITHGTNNDQNLITTFTLDKLGRTTAASDPLGNVSSMTYYRDGQTESMTDPLSIVTKYRYDAARRQTLLVQGFVDNGQDPAQWKWNGTNWTKADGSTLIAFGTNTDQNVIVQSSYDKVGRTVSRRDPKGHLTTYTYDLLNRRTSLTDPLSHAWTTSYANLNRGVMQTQATDPLGYITQRTTDRLGRLTNLQYLSESPKYTPDVAFAYDKAGNALSMTETNGGSHPNRITRFAYDGAYRLAQANFDVNGDGSSIQTVGYQYDAGGLRTTLTLPGNLSVTYVYDAKGRLQSLSDWNLPSAQTTQFTYDGADRPLTAARQSALTSTYAFDAASRLTTLNHKNGASTLASFAYSVDARGNRTGVVETQALTPSGTDTHNIAYSYDNLSRLSQAIQRAGATLGSGTLQHQFNYQYDVAGNRTQQIVNLTGTAATTNYTFDNANQLSGDGTYTYTYDNNGNLTLKKQGVATIDTYTWDRANRLRSLNAQSYAYDGNGRRIAAGSTTYVPDVQAGLWKMLSATTGANTLRYIHGPMGVLEQQNADATWDWTLLDAQGSVRGMTNASFNVLESRLYSPYGEYDPSNTAYQTSGSQQSVFGFTSEPRDGNNLVYLRARYLNPTLGSFVSRDPYKGCMSRAMSINGYSYVEGNVINATDPSGMRGLFYNENGDVTPQFVRPTHPAPSYTPPAAPPSNPVQVAFSAIQTFLNAVFPPAPSHTVVSVPVYIPPIPKPISSFVLGIRAIEMGLLENIGRLVIFIGQVISTLIHSLASPNKDASNLLDRKNVNKLITNKPQASKSNLAPVPCLGSLGGGKRNWIFFDLRTLEGGCVFPDVAWIAWVGDGPTQFRIDSHLVAERGTGPFSEMADNWDASATLLCDRDSCGGFVQMEPPYPPDTSYDTVFITEAVICSEKPVRVIYGGCTSRGLAALSRQLWRALMSNIGFVEEPSFPPNSNPSSPN